MVIRVTTPQAALSPAGTPLVSSGGISPGGIADVAGQQAEQLGAQVEQAGLLARGIATELQFEHDQASSNEALSQFMGQVDNELMDPTTGYLNKRGKEAVDARQAAVEKIEGLRQQFASSLQSQNSRGMFGRGADEAMRGVMRRMNGHQAQEQRIWSIGQSEAIQLQHEVSATDLFLAGDTPEPIVDGVDIADQQRRGGVGFVAPSVSEDDDDDTPPWRVHMESALKAAQQTSQQKGESPEQAEVRMMASRAKVYSNNIQGLLDQGRTKEAESFFEQIKGDLPAVMRSKMGRQIEQAGRGDRALERAADIIEAVNNPRQPREVANPAPSEGANLADPVEPTLQFSDGRPVTMENRFDPPGDLPPFFTEQEMSDARQAVAVEAGEPVLQFVDGEPVTMENRFDPPTPFEAEVQQHLTPGGAAAGQSTNAGTNLVGRAYNELMKEFRAGNIDSQDFSMTLARVQEFHRVRVNARVEEVANTMREAEAFLENNRSVLSPDSPGFPTSLRDDLIEAGQLDAIRAVGIRLNGDRQDAAVKQVRRAIYGQAIQDYDTGKFSQMNLTGLYAAYGAALGQGTEWTHIKALHEKANAAPNTPTVFSLDEEVYRRAGAAGILTDQRNDGVPKASDGSQERELDDLRGAVHQAWSTSGLDAQKDRGKLLEMVDDIIEQRVGDEALWQRQFRGIENKEARLEFEIEASDGTDIIRADIPTDAQSLIEDEFKLSLMAASGDARLKTIQEQYGAIEILHQGEERRRRIDALWRAVGLDHRRAPARFMADAWIRFQSDESSPFGPLKQPQGVGPLFEGFGPTGFRGVQNLVEQQIQAQSKGR